MSLLPPDHAEQPDREVADGGASTGGRRKVERSTPPVTWPRLEIARANLPAFAARLAAVVAGGIGSPPRVRVHIDGFEGYFEQLEDIDQRVSERDWMAAGHYTIRLSDASGTSRPLTVILRVTADKRATLRLTGDRSIVRNGLLPELELVVQDAIDAEVARRRRRRRLARRLERQRLWAAVAAISAAIAAGAAVLELHPLGL
jgi:hypothetical protein